MKTLDLLRDACLKIAQKKAAEDFKAHSKRQFLAAQKFARKMEAQALLALVRDYCYVATECDPDSGHFVDEIACDNPEAFLDHVEALIAESL